MVMGKVALLSSSTFIKLATLQPCDILWTARSADFLNASTLDLKGAAINI